MGKNKSGYVNVRRYQVIVQQEGGMCCMPYEKTAKSPAEVLPSKICFLENDAFAESSLYLRSRTSKPVLAHKLSA